MNFNDIQYKRLDYDDVKKKYEKSISVIENADNFSDIKEEVSRLNITRNTLETMKEFASIKYSIDTKDSFFIEENRYWDHYMPMFQDLNIDFYKALLNSPFKKEIIDEYGLQFYKLIKCNVDVFSKDIINLLQEENRLMSKYTELLASAKIDFDGKTCNLSDMSAYMSSPDRETRRKAVRLHTEFFSENEDEFDDIYDRLVSLRHEMAVKLGYSDFIEMGYKRMQRTDFDESMVENLRKSVIEKYVPMAETLYREQAERIGVKRLTYYDEKLEFTDGNAKPVGDGDYILEKGAEMYREMSPEIEEFYNFLMENSLFDVKARPNKAMGGYCTILPLYREPFIFGNFNSTVDDIDVLTHEAGHAFQVYMSRDIDMPEIIFPTLESCEIHSMSMEFFTYPWMGLFFGEDAEKYKKYHYESAIKFIPYGTLVDHFQHEIYRNPSMSRSERKTLWRELEKKYLPHRDYEDLDVLERGGYWFRQGHIFKDPFYYIDYVLAQLCALQFKDAMDRDYREAWSRYLDICRIGGKYSFLEIVKRAGLKSPFEPDDNI